MNKLKTFFTPPIYDTGQSYRALWWVAHTLSIGFVFSLLLNIVLSSLLICMFPLKELKPVFLTTLGKGEQIIKVEPIEKTLKGFELLTETLVRRFVVLRETFDLQTEGIRWKEMSLMCSEALQEAFNNVMDPQKNDHSPYKKREQDQVKRTVEITSASRLTSLNQDQHIWMVEWQSTEQHQGQVLSQENWTSTLTIGFKEQHLKHGDELINPVGFMVFDYTIARRKKYE